MTDIVKGVLEDQRKGILLSDFSGGVITDTGGLSLSANQSPDALNVFAWEGNLRFRGGYDEYSTLPAGTDGAFTYYDINQNVHMVEWAGGNMYDVLSGSPVVIASGVYTPGQIIAHEQLNGILYWSTLTVPLRQWNGTTEQAVSNAGGTGVVPPPACEFLIAFNGSLVAVNYVSGGIHQQGAFIWSNVNDPHTWVGANNQTVGSNDGGSCVFALLMGIAQVGVSPTKQFMVGKNNGKIFLYEGALGSLTENAVSSPVGIADGGSAVYIPTKAGLGAVMFLGDDAQFYLCNGIECPVSSEGIKILVGNIVGTALRLNAGQRFHGVYNQRFQYYLCDFGNNTQLAYKWDTGAWWLFEGWPSGVYSTAATTNGLPSVFVGANFAGNTGVYELALDQTNDNGNPINAYWTSAYIHGGKPERLKIFEEVTMFSYNVGVQYAVTATAMPQSNGVIPQTKTLLFNDPQVGAVPPPASSTSLWGIAKWGINKWGGNPTSLAQPYLIGGMKGPLVVPSPISKWGPAGYPLPLRTGAAQFKIAWNAGVPDFRVTSFKIAFIFQNENVGILPFTSQGQVMNVAPNWGNKFTNTGPTSSPPLDLPLPPGPPPPPPRGCYSISGGVLTRTCVANEYVAFALGDADGGNPTGVYAWDNLGNSAVVVGKTALITGITQANPGVVTAPNHGFVTDDIIYISGVVGMTQVNGGGYTVANATTNTFELHTLTPVPHGSPLDTTGYTAYVSGGIIYSDSFNNYASPYLIDGESGIVVDTVNNVLFSQGFNYNAGGAGGDLSLVLNTAAPVAGSSISGPFAPRASVHYPAYIAGADSSLCWNSLALSLDRKYLYVSTAATGAYTAFVILKIRTADAAVVAVSHTISTSDSLEALALSPDGTRIYAFGYGAVSSDIQIVTLDAGDLSTLNQQSATAPGSNIAPFGFAISDDGSKVAMTSSAGFSPFQIECYVLDTASFALSSFALTPSSNFNGQLTFPKGDRGNVLVYESGVLNKYSLAGALQTIYTLGITGDQGATSVVTEPNTGLIYGTSYGTNENILWTYDLAGGSLVTEVHGIPSSGGMPAITFGT